MTTISTPRPLWQKALIIVLLIIGVLITVRFSLRAVRSFMVLRHRPFPPASETDVELIRGWMTVPYIAKVYSVPDKLLWESLGMPPLEPDEARKTPLFQINQQYFPNQQMEALKRVKQAILDFQAHLPPPPPNQAPAGTPAP